MIAYAGLAGLPPQAGLYTLLAAPAAYAIFGTRRHVVAAGTSAAAVLVASTVAGFGALSSGQYAANAARTRTSTSRQQRNSTNSRAVRTARRSTSLSRRPAGR
jgi:MFS superfamily sulfate permease-like transporter